MAPIPICFICGEEKIKSEVKGHWACPDGCDWED